MSSDPATKGPRRSIRIGKYEVLSHIATGGMGAVYKARDTETGREVALKVLSPEMAAKPGMVERFRREAKHAQKLRHENVVTLHEFGEANHTYFLVMEFIDGIDLHEYSNRKGPLDPAEALQIILQACRALAHAYEQGIIHRDIKPSNFLVSSKGDELTVKMTDLGLAREKSNEEFRVTKAGTTVGTLDYMAPEQAHDSGLADIRSDLYSLGSTWYHLLAGHAPFPKGGLGERLHRIMNEEPPDVHKFNPRVSEPTLAVLRRLMAKRRTTATRSRPTCCATWRGWPRAGRFCRRTNSWPTLPRKRANPRGRRRARSRSRPVPPRAGAHRIRSAAVRGRIRTWASPLSKRRCPRRRNRPVLRSGSPWPARLRSSWSWGCSSSC